MTTKFYAVLTHQGAARLAKTTALGTTLNLTHMAVGDANGAVPLPDPAQTTLVHQRRIAPLNTLSVDPQNSNQIIAEQVIPEDEGGFWIREIGLFDDEGVLIAVANSPETYKPQLQEGCGRTQTIRMMLSVLDTSAITLKIDPSVVLASRQYVTQQIMDHEQSRRHPDASLTAKGFTQLSSATNSAAENLAATPKAVKLANDNANSRVSAERKVNGYTLANDVTITSSDIFDGQSIQIGNAQDLNTYIKAGLYHQLLTGWAQAGKNYPELLSGSLIVYKHAGITQEYRVYNSHNTYVRTLYDNKWSAWRKNYHSLQLSGGTVTGQVGINYDGDAMVIKAQTPGYATYIVGQDADKSNNWSVGKGSVNNNDVFLANYKGQSNRVTLKADGSIDLITGTKKTINLAGEVVSTVANSWRIAYGNYGAFWRQDGLNLYLMLTNSGDSYGGFNALRPLVINLTSGHPVMSRLALTDYTNFDNRYQAKGSYTPAGQAYTKAESDARYVQNIRVSATLSRGFTDGGGWSTNDSAFATAINMVGSDRNVGTLMVRYVQKKVNNTWLNVVA